MAKIVLSIVSHGQQELVNQLLLSIDDYLISRKHNIKILVTENMNKYWSASSSVYDLKMIYNLRLKGFGQNHNSNFESIESDYFFIVNPDIILTNKINLDDIISLMQNDKIDIATPVILNSLYIKEDYARADLTFFNLIGRLFYRKPSKKVDWFAGMFLILRSESFRYINGFDPKFYMYVEDCDLCKRAKLAGMKLHEIDNMFVVHAAQRQSHKSMKYFLWHVSSLLRYWRLL